MYLSGRGLASTAVWVGRLVSSRLTDVRVELLSGTATIEVNEIPKGTSLALTWREQTVPILRAGLYRFQAGADSMRVYVAKGKLQLAGMKGALKSGRYVDLSGAGTLSAAVKYDVKEGDEFDRWNRSRGEQLALASVSAVNAFLRQPYSFRSSAWFLDPFFGFYTYLPYSYAVRSPFGFTYQCPRAVYHQGRPSTGTRAGGASGGGASGGAAGHAGGSSSGSSGGVSRPSSPSSGSGGRMERSERHLDPGKGRIN